MLNKTETIDDDDALEQGIAAVAAALADPSRVKMLCALMDGRAFTATELAAVADIASSTASAHLARLVSSRLISCLSQGRHRYYRLAGRDIAQLLETIMGVSWPSVRSPSPRVPGALRQARTCYDHLAGEVAVAIFDAMTAGGWLNADASSLTVLGQEGFARMGISLNATAKRKPCCACLDWSERRAHLGGEAGAALFAYAEQQGWLTRPAGCREVTFTARGKRALKTWFNLDL
nr:winged helix-turn-helix domain-containing protein [uncultured Enterobacter sp.]